MAQQNEVPLPISFGADDTSKVNNKARGITQVNQRTINQNVFNSPQMIQKGAASQSRFGSNIDETNKSQFGSSKYPVQIITLELDDAPSMKQKQKQKQEIIAVVEPEMEIKADNIRYTNDLSSYAVKDQIPSQVLSGLTAVLVNYSQDMDIKIDEQNNVIEGVVFIENYYGIKFRINIWSEDKNISRFELIRTSGDAMATAKFLGDIKTQFFIDVTPKTDDNDNDDDDENEPELNFVALSLDAGSLDLKELFRELSLPKQAGFEMDEKEDSISKQELDDVNDSLINNEMESIDELQFLHEKLKENGAISKDIMNHEELVKTIISEALKNRDICVVRGCLLILECLCNDNKIALLLVEQFGLFENLINLLNHKYALIKNYSVRLLAKLADEGKKWNMNKNAAKNIKELVQKYQNEWKDSILVNNGFLNENMFNSIYKKLTECN